MSYKSAKDQYTKDEIIEILKRNVALFKDEKEFVDYIVNLAMYLIDRNYGSGPRPELMLLEKMTPPSAPGAPGVTSPATPRLSSKSGVHKKQQLHTDELPPPRAEDLRRRHTYDVDPLEDYLQNVPPPRPFDLSPGTPSTPPPSPEPEIIENELPDELDLKPPPSKIFQVEGGLSTPPAQDSSSKLRNRKEKPPQPNAGSGENSIDQIDVENRGKMRVYRVVRSYKSQSAVDVPCPVCGNMVPIGSKRCANCGHVL